MNTQDFLLEIGCEELPAKYQATLADALAKQLSLALDQCKLSYGKVKTFSTPRRLAVYIKDVCSTQEQQQQERLGPNVKSAFDKNGMPTIACMGFARSLGISTDTLKQVETPKGKRVAAVINIAGKNTLDLLPELIENSVQKLPIHKPMRWGNNTTEFIRPVHWITAIFGKDIIDCELLGHKTSNTSYGHRFHSPRRITILKPSEYETQLHQAHVIADATKRQQCILKQLTALAAPNQIVDNAELLDEVTALVEWPVGLRGKIDADFLGMPREVLITCMQVHQKTFAVENAQHNLQAEFIVISNIESKDKSLVIRGNERVIRARLSDAKFFFEQDLKTPLEANHTLLKNIIFQKELGSVEEKVKRITKLAGHIAKQLKIDLDHTKRACLLAKCDLLSQMVGEFPSLQGTMGCTYAEHNKEPHEVAIAIKEHYQPRFAKDQLPESLIGASIAIADKLDTLVGIIGIKQLPTGDKDPYGLRRAGLGILKIIIEKQLPLDLADLIKQSKKSYGGILTNADVTEQSLELILVRLKAYYLDQDISAEVYAAVEARQITQPLDFDLRIKAVSAFLQLPQAQALAAANKRVNNILKKQAADTHLTINSDLFENPAEKNLVKSLSAKRNRTEKLYLKAQYNESLAELSELKEPIDSFFDEVMVMSEDKKIRNNRIAILQEIQKLFMKVADISQLS